MKLINILKEVISEAKQVGNLYHYTPIENIKDIVTSQYLKPNDENQISTSVRANMNTSEFSGMEDESVARIMLDGDKISNKYKIQPFSYENEENLGEEVILTNGKVFPLMPYLKRIDLFLGKSKENKIKSTINILNKLNIPHKIYNGTPLDNIPYTQPKDGSPENIKIKHKTDFNEYTLDDMYYPGMKTKEIKTYIFDYRNKLIPTETTVGISPQYPDYYLAHEFKSMYDIMWGDVVNSKGKKLNTKIIPIPMYNDKKWREKWKNVPSWNKFSNRVSDSYVLIPKKEIGR